MKVSSVILSIFLLISVVSMTSVSARDWKEGDYGQVRWDSYCRYVGDYISYKQRSPMWTSLPLQFSMHSFHTRGRSLLHVQKCIWKECRLWLGTWVGLWLHSRPYLWSFFRLWRFLKKKTFARYWKLLDPRYWVCYMYESRYGMFVHGWTPGWVCGYVPYRTPYGVFAE
jgi:hypothetical protein